MLTLTIKTTDQKKILPENSEYVNNRRVQGHL